MSAAAGEGILDWLDTAITSRYAAAKSACGGGEGRWHNGWIPAWMDDPDVEDGDSSGAGVSDERDETIVYDEGGRPSEAQSVHIALNDPESVLRRCAADRKLLELHGGNMHSCPATDDTGYLDEWTQFSYGDACPVVQLLAEGYGWTEAQR